MTAVRFTQIDYEREMALILTEPCIPGTTDIFGIVRIIADPDNERGEYAIIVRHDVTGMVRGVPLLRRIVDLCTKQGNRRDLRGRPAGEQNHAQALRRHGFSQARVLEEPVIVRVTYVFLFEEAG